MNNHIATNNLFVKSKILFPVRYNNKSMFFHNKAAWQTYNCYYWFTQECPLSRGFSEVVTTCDYCDQMLSQMFRFGLWPQQMLGPVFTNSLYVTLKMFCPLVTTKCES